MNKDKAAADPVKRQWQATLKLGQGTGDRVFILFCLDSDPAGLSAHFPKGRKIDNVVPAVGFEKKELKGSVFEERIFYPVENGRDERGPVRRLQVKVNFSRQVLCTFLQSAGKKNNGSGGSR